MFWVCVSSLNFKPQMNLWRFNTPIVDESIDPLLSQLPSGLMVVVVISPAEHHQALRLGIPNEGKVLKQLLRVPADPLKKAAKEAPWEKKRRPV